MKIMTTRAQDRYFAETVLRQHSGYTGRIRIYFREMYPIPSRLLTSTLLFVSFTLLVSFVQGQEAALDLRWCLQGSLSGFFLALILRLMDELKDARIDRTLFPERPVSSGRVRLSDIRGTLVIVSALLLVVNGTTGSSLMSASVLLMYALLMFRYFYLSPRLKAKLLINLATHNPVVPLLLFHFVVLFALQHHISFSHLNAGVLLVVGMYWALLLAWELARKVRYRREESGYQTYSRIFGPFGAAALSFSVQSLAFGAGIYLVYTGRLSSFCLILLVAAYVWLLRGYTRFLLRKVTSGQSLRITAEQFSALIMSAAPTEFILQMVKSHDLF
jgi:4-hydroxybenzoate polyprenyltransferase